MGRFSYSMPEILRGNVHISSMYGNHNASGRFTSYGIDIELRDIFYIKTLKSTDEDVLVTKLEGALVALGKKYQKHLADQHAAVQLEDVDHKNHEIKENTTRLDNLLKHTLSIDDAVDWDQLLNKNDFSIDPKSLYVGQPMPAYIKFDSAGEPIEWTKTQLPNEPILEEVRQKFGFFTRLLMKGKVEKSFMQQLEDFKERVEFVNRENSSRDDQFAAAKLEYSELESDYQKAQIKANKAVEKFKNAYEKSQTDAIEEYCDLVLANSDYPSYFPQSWQLEYRPEPKMVVVEYNLPAPSQLPTVTEYKFVKSRDRVDIKEMSAAKAKIQFESVNYQIALRTIHELFEADTIDSVDIVTFNGVVAEKNPATGNIESKIILSISAEKSKFLELSLGGVDPKQAFKGLKGVSAATLVNLVPIPPIVQLDKNDRRIIEGREIVDDLDASVNLAAMDWEDFEHLIREVFEKEFIGVGGEVKVTQASVDRGVDAIAFDPDPIRGGKIVIQAKRYTNVVDVSAVRDLFGTMMDEGATKGILVTTSDYGKASYEFAKDKPITLMNGNNLLSLLEKHGHEARINIAEAKLILAD